MINRLLVAMILITYVGILIGCSRKAEKPAPKVVNDNPATAVEFVQDLMDARWTDAIKLLSDQASLNVSTDELRQTWTILVTDYGDPKKIGKTKATTESGYEVIFVECQLEKTILDVKLIFGADGKIHGFGYAPRNPKKIQEKPAETSS